MKAFQNHLIKLSVVCLAGILLFACNPGRKLGRQYAAKTDSLSVMVIFPPNVFVINEKHDQKRESFYFSEALKDTSLLRYSVLLPQLSNESLLEPFSKAYLAELRQYGFKVYDTGKMDEFLLQTGAALMVNLAQMEVQEYETTYEDAITVGSDVFTKTIYLTGFNIGAWFELSPINQPGGGSFPVLFATNDITDRWNGFFTQRFLTGEVQYRLNIDSLNMNDIHKFTAYLGRLYAAYTFDYLMNIDINKKLPEEERGKQYFRYDPYEKRVFTTITDRFTEL